MMILMNPSEFDCLYPLLGGLERQHTPTFQPSDRHLVGGLHPFCWHKQWAPGGWDMGMEGFVSGRKHVTKTRTHTHTHTYNVYVYVYVYVNVYAYVYVFASGPKTVLVRLRNVFENLLARY